jgi:serine/threonine protein kinase
MSSRPSEASRLLTPKIFIVADQAEYRALVKHHVTTHWPKAQVSEYDPVASGRLPDSFSGAGSDVVLLGHPAGDGDALDWLRRFRRIRHFPPVVFLGDGSERQIIAAMKAGAAEYLSKPRLTHDRLIEIIESVLPASRSTSTIGSFPFESDSFADAPLQRLRNYRLQRRLASGEISSVYLVTDQMTGRELALKVLRQMPDSGGEIVFDRFLQEYELIAKIDHPNVVKIFDLGVADDHAYIAMEYCSHGSLKRRIAIGLEPEQAWEYLRHMAEALGALHSAGIMHRDLKPTNVMFREDDSLVLIDFGLAKQAQLHAEITGAGQIFGTPYYMSPEQGHGAKVDERGDIYSLGIIFFEMLTGRKPYEGDTAMSVIIQHRQAGIPTLPDEHSRFQAFIGRMMAKEPEDRFQSVDELLDFQAPGTSVSVA